MLFVKKMLWISPKMFLLHLKFSVLTWDAVSEWIAFLSEQRRWLQFKSYKPNIQRQQIFAIFDSYPPPADSFLLLSVGKFDKFLTHPHPKFADILQGVSSGFNIIYLALADRNMQIRFGLKVVWEFWVRGIWLMTLWFD